MTLIYSDFFFADLHLQIFTSIFFIDFYFDDLHLQIIESISPIASIENSSAQWAIFLIIGKKTIFLTPKWWHHQNKL